MSSDTFTQPTEFSLDDKYYVLPKKEHYPPIRINIGEVISNYLTTINSGENSLTTQIHDVTYFEHANSKNPTLRDSTGEVVKDGTADVTILSRGIHIEFETPKSIRHISVNTHGLVTSVLEFRK